MEKKKIIIISVIFVIIVTLILIFTLSGNDDNGDKNSYKNSSSLVEAVLKKNNVKENNYKKFNGGEVLNQDTSFAKYAFISNNSIYIFNPSKLKSGELSYKKVYDVPSDIKVMNIVSGFGSDIKFFDDNDTLYTLHDENIDNKVSDSYDMYEKAVYNLSDYLKWEYSTEFLGKKISYDFMSEYVYAKDNVLYRKLYNSNDEYPTLDKMNGNYEGEKIIRIYNERILKTDKGFYEIMSYFDNDLNKTVTTTVKINMLTKYYDEVLTFTYEYVVLKDYTLIPINDVMENRVRDYSYDYFLSGFNSMDEVRYEE